MYVYLVINLVGKIKRVKKDNKKRKKARNCFSSLCGFWGREIIFIYPKFWTVSASGVKSTLSLSI